MQLEKDAVQCMLPARRAAIACSFSLRHAPGCVPTPPHPPTLTLPPGVFHPPLQSLGDMMEAMMQDGALPRKDPPPTHVKAA